jgi:anti-sigma-K factor RskA
VMNNVAPPPPGSVYQMWLLDGGTPRSAGTMNGEAVRPSTTAVLTDLGSTNALAFTVEPGTGSPQPTGQIFAKLSLT